MLLLHEAPAGYMLFRLLDDAKKSKPEELFSKFSNPSKLHQLVKLESFQAYESTTDAVASATALIDGKVEKPLKKFLKKHMKSDGDTLGVADSKLAQAIKKKVGIKCEVDTAVNELLRNIRRNVSELVPDLKNSMSDADENSAYRSMQLGLAHSLSRYKLKFSPDKVDTMIVQSIGLLDELDKELNTYAMRVREWYGWHFPELGKLIADNIVYARLVLKVGNRHNIKSMDLSDLLEKPDEDVVKSTCEISMGTDISDEDILSIRNLCTQVIDLSQYRAKLSEYLRNRMHAIAPNLTELVGELVGARLIAQSGSLLNLAKVPASTVQILGSEKALFRAMKSGGNTPKYGLLYHASLVGQVGPKNKGKISRVLAAKASLAIRVDALGDQEGVTIGTRCREQVEQRVRILEEKDPIVRKSLQQNFKKYTKPNEDKQVFDDSADMVIEKKRKIEEVATIENGEEIDDANEKIAKKLKKSKKEKKSKKDKKAKKSK